MDYRFDFASEDYDAYSKFIKKSGLGLSCPVIHIAGSNGKSSTANILAAIYEAAGYKVGLFINTYFYHPCEMIKFNHKDMKQEAFAEKEFSFAKLFEKFELSAFQRCFAIALSYFKDMKPDICVIETGLGGSLDATHIPYEDLALAIITNISLEHTELLGTTLSQIGEEKCGILQEGVPVLFGKLDESCSPTMMQTAISMDAPIHKVDDPHFIHLDRDGFHFDYGGKHDLCLHSLAHFDLPNACLALEAVEVLKERFPVEEDMIRKGLEVQQLPAHFHRRGNILFDMAENPAALSALLESLRIFRNLEIHAIYASRVSQNIAVALPLIDNVATSITLTTFDDPEARVQDDYFLYEPDHAFAASFQDAKKAISEAHPESLILVIGCQEFVYACLKEEHA